MTEARPNDCVIRVVRGDIVTQRTTAIVCPANSYGHMRGGVAQRIRQAGGDVIEYEARARAPIRIGEAVCTSAGKLPAQHVLHAPTMVEPVAVAAADDVYTAATAAVREARRRGFQSISFPSMGTGTGGMPYAQAATLICRALMSELKAGCLPTEVVLVAASEACFVAFTRALAGPSGLSRTRLTIQ